MPALATSIARRPLPLLLLGAAIGGAVLWQTRATAAPTVQGREVACSWRVLERGPTRTQHTLVALPGAGLLAFAGGERDAGEASVLSDLQRLSVDGGRGSWRAQAAGGSGPGARAQHVAVTRGDTSEMLTYGGVDELVSFGGGGGGTFTWRSPLLAGGAAPSGQQGAFAPMGLVGDAFRLSVDGGNATWSPLSIPGRPLADASAVWWPRAEAMVIFGGRLSEEAISATSARQLISVGGPQPSVDVVEDAGGPAPRYAHSAVFDPETERMFVFGGTRNWLNGRNDVWALDLSTGWDGATWAPIESQGRPPTRRFDHVAAWHPGLQSMIVFGGTRNGSDSLDDIWALDLSTSTPLWRELDPEGPSPAGVSGAAAAWSASEGEGELIVYGGEAANTSSRDAWALSCTATDGETPTAPAPTDTPQAPATATAVAPPTDVPVGRAIYLPWGQG